MSAETGQPQSKISIAISGASGLVGQALSDRLAASGADIRKITRRAPQSPSEVEWNPESGLKDAEQVSGIDAVVHLAGENISEGRWTEAKKRRIRDSRVIGTRTLCESLARATHPPRTLLCASAVGFYGDRGAELLDEESASGSGYLPEVCREWEAATAPASDAGIRVVNLRFGVILSGRGGALTKMLLPFKLGVGGRIGSGEQYMSWIALDDVIGGIEHTLKDASLQGPVNVVSPEPVTNAEFTRTLGGVLHRWTIFPMPAFAARLALGQMADDLLLASARVYPRRLLETGYVFRFPTLGVCLEAEVSRDSRRSA